MLELNKVYNMDCLDGMHDMIASGQTVDCIITDPPYLINYKTGMRDDKNHRFTKPILNDNNPELIKNYFKLCYEILKPNKALYSFCDIDKLDVFKQFLVDAGFIIRNIIIWNKGGGGMGDLKTSFAPDYEVIILANKGSAEIIGKRCGSVWNVDKVWNAELVHQNQKPLNIIFKIIKAHTNAGDTVFDGFMGSFTTAVACHRMGRNFVGCELDPYYFNVGTKRLNAEMSQISMFVGGALIMVILILLTKMKQRRVHKWKNCL